MHYKVFSVFRAKMLRAVMTLAAAALLMLPSASCAAGHYDVVVAGGGIGGIAAAIQAARLGAGVLVVEPSSWIGGQATAAGVSTMDDLSRLKSGIYLEYITKLKEYYDSRGKPMGTCYWDNRSVAFEPSVGQRVLYEMIKEAGGRKNRITVMLNSSVESVAKDGKRIVGASVRSAAGRKDVSCSVLIDATEYGDILPIAGASYRAGNSVSPFVKTETMIQDITWPAVIRRYAGGIPAHLRPLSPLPGYELAKRNYGSYVVKGGSDFKGVYPVKLPVNFVSHNAYRGLPNSSDPWSYDASKEDWPRISKCGVNWGNDYPGKYGWNGRSGLPAAYLEDPQTREEIERDALIKTLHFIYYIQNELGEDWSVTDDEYDHKELPKAAMGLPREWLEIVRRMPPIPYVRESRRVVGDYTLTSEEMLHNSLSYRDGQTSHEFTDAIAIGGYILDLHGAATDSDMEWDLGERASSMYHNRPRGPFQVPMRILVPKDIDGLIAAEKNLSMSRLASGAIRLQPICMMTGQAAGALAALAVRENARVRDVPAVNVQLELLKAGVVLSLCNYTDVPQGHPCYAGVQISNLCGLLEPVQPPHAPSYNISDLDDPVLAMAMIKGTDKGVFGADEMVTRAESLSMLNKARSAAAVAGADIESGEKSDAFITRGTFAKDICAAFGFSERAKNASGGTSFSESDHPSAEAVAILASFGVLDIYGDDKDFRFGRPVTRAEAAEITARAMAASFTNRQSEQRK